MAPRPRSKTKVRERGTFEPQPQPSSAVIEGREQVWQLVPMLMLMQVCLLRVKGLWILAFTDRLLLSGVEQGTTGPSVRGCARKSGVSDFTLRRH